MSIISREMSILGLLYFTVTSLVQGTYFGISGFARGNVLLKHMSPQHYRP